MATVFAPRALRGVADETRGRLDSLVLRTLEIKQAEADQRDLVDRLRRDGLSWASIGWATGMTGEGARRRWGN